MALSPREFVEEVDKFFDIIEQRRKSVSNQDSKRVKFGNIDIYDIKDEVVEITVSLHRLFISQQSINNLSPQDTSKVIKKACVIALACVCQFFKEFDFSQESNFWQFFGEETGLSVNSSFYSKILEPVFVEEKIMIEPLPRYINYTSVIANEADLSVNCLDNILEIFAFYMKYFYPTLEIRDFFKDINFILDNSSWISSIPEGDELKETIKLAIPKISDIKERVIKVFEQLVEFVSYINNSKDVFSLANLDSLIEVFNNEYSINISFVLKDQQLKNKFLNLFPSVTPSKFKKVLLLSEQSEQLVTPLGETIIIKDFQLENLLYGTYKLGNQEYDVSPDFTLPSSFFTSLDKEKLFVYGNKIAYLSSEEYSIKIGYNESTLPIKKIFSNKNLVGYLWVSSKPLFEPVYLQKNDSEEIQELYQANESLNSSLYLKLTELKGVPKLELNLDYLIFVSKQNKGKKIEILNIDQPSIHKEFNADKVAYTGQITYPIKNKRPTKIDLLLVNGGELLKLKEFEPRLTRDMTDTMLFDVSTSKQVLPSRNIEFGNNHYFLFTVKNFDVKWVNESCEVTQFNNFGKYHVYEIKWIETERPLEIKVDYEHRWIFHNYISSKVDFKDYKNTQKGIDFKKNQFINIKDMSFKVTFNSDKIQYSNLKLSLAYNFENIVLDVRVSQINTLLGRDSNSIFIDEEFIKTLMAEHKELSYGRYTFKFKLNDTNILDVDTFYIPELYAEEQNDLYQQDDEIIVNLSTDDIPCFRNNKVSQNYLFDKTVSGNFITNSNKHIEFKKEIHTKKARLFNPYTEVTLKVEPDVAAFTFMQEGRFFNTDILNYYNLDKISLVMRAPQKDARLKVNNNVVKPLTTNNSGIILEPLKSIKGYLSKRDNIVSMQMAKQELSFQVVWNTKVSSFTTDKPLFSEESGLTFLMTYEGYSSAHIKFYITDQDGKNLDVKRISCGEDNAPKFLRYDRNKNCIFISCDGKKWENRLFTVWLEPSVLKNTKEVFIRGVHEYNNEKFGEIVFKNENQYSELKKLNTLAKNNPENPYVFFERGFVYSELSLTELAEKDFDKSLSCGLDDSEAKSYIELFKKDLKHNTLSKELVNLFYLVDKFYQDELLSDVE